MDNQHTEIPPWKIMVIEENPPNMKPQCLKDLVNMEDFIRRRIQGEELTEIKI